MALQGSGGKQGRHGLIVCSGLHTGLYVKVMKRRKWRKFLRARTQGHRGSFACEVAVRLSRRTPLHSGRPIRRHQGGKLRSTLTLWRKRGLNFRRPHNRHLLSSCLGLGSSICRRRLAAPSHFDLRQLMSLILRACNKCDRNKTIFFLLDV